MGQFHSGLKCVFILFNVFLLIGGILLLALTTLVTLKSDSVAWLTMLGSFMSAGLCVFTPICGFISICKEKRPLLKSYCIICVTVISSVLSLSVGVFYREVRQVKQDSFMWQFKDAVMSSDNNKAALSRFQSMAECCGILGYNDWNNNIPQSCECPSSLPSTDCTEVLSNQRAIYVYTQPCGPLMVYFLQLGVNLVLGLLFGLTAIALICMFVGMALLKVARCCPLETH